MFFPSWGGTMPLCFLQIHGIMCCKKMLATWESSPFTKNFFCYEAVTSKEANVLILWGSFTKKLAHVLEHSAEVMMARRYIIHMAGCRDLIDNNFLAEIPVDKIFYPCSQEKAQFKTLIHEARRCLRA